MSIAIGLFWILLGVFFQWPASLGAIAETKELVLDRIVAVINEDIITQTELDKEIRATVARLRQQDTPLPSKEVLRKQVLEKLIVRRLQLERAANLGIQIEKDLLNRTLERIAEQNRMSLDRFRRVLARDGVRFSEFREKIREELTIKRVRQRQIANRVTVTEKEIKDFLAAKDRDDQSQQEFHLAQILIAVPEAGSPEEIAKTRQKANQLLTQLRSGADFAKKAVAVSDGQQALDGGDLGWRPRSKLPTLFAKIVPKMQVGEIKGPLRSPSGFHLLKLLDRRGGNKHIVQEFRARHILIRTNGSTSDREARDLLKQLKRRVEEGDANFASLARTHSEDKTTAPNGGKLGWVTAGELDPRLERAMRALDPGEISSPIETPAGLHLIQVLERRSQDKATELKRSKARKAIRQRKIEEQTQAWLRKIRNQAYVEYRLKR